MYRCVINKKCDYNGNGCCIECTKTSVQKKECSCDCVDYFNRPEKCPLARREYKSEQAGELESDL